MILWTIVGLCTLLVLAFLISYWWTHKYDQATLMKAFLDHSLSCIYVKDMDLKYRFVNRHALEVFGFKEEEVIGKTDEELFHAPYAIASKITDLQVLQQGLTTKEELIADLRTGNRDFYTIKTPLKGANGKIYALCGMATDITKQKSAQRQLNNYLERLEDVTTELMESRIIAEQVNRSQNAFLSSMSHELRTPLNGIIGNASLLLNTTIEPEQEKYVDRIQSSALALMGIINQVLDFSKIAAGKIKLDLQRCDLVGIAKECIQILAVKAEEKNLNFKVELPPEPFPMVSTDPTRLKELFLNVLGNAIKFTERGSVTLKVSLIASAGSKILVRIDVIDTGVGMSEEQLAHAFERFWQNKPTFTGGTGLGLAITKELITLMNGEIHIDSILNEGTVVTIKIPFEVL